MHYDDSKHLHCDCLHGDSFCFAPEMRMVMIATQGAIEDAAAITNTA